MSNALNIETIQLSDGRKVHGFVDAGYGLVLDTFVENFERRSDVGAGCSAVIDGNPVVELWGGTADLRDGRPQTRDTAAVGFSCTKGVMAACAFLLVQDGLLQLDEPVATYWPEFAQNGKESITVRHVMSHRAGVPALDRALTRAEVLAWTPVIRAIEEQRPLYGSDDGFAYHSLTFGWLVGELIRRLTHHMPGAFLRERITDPLDLRLWIGVPEVVDDIAWMEAPLTDEDSSQARLAADLMAADSVLNRSLSMGGAFHFPADPTGHVTFNDVDIQRSQIPGANGVCGARALASFYSACLGTSDRQGLLTRSSIGEALGPRSWGAPLNGAPDDGARWGTGFQISSPPSQPMLGDASFGHAGAGGQLGFADAEFGVGFAYVSNQMGGYGDIRARELTVALSNCL